MMSPHDLGPAFVAGPRFLLTEYVSRVLTLNLVLGGVSLDVAGDGSIAWSIAGGSTKLLYQTVSPLTARPGGELDK